MTFYRHSARFYKFIIFKNTIGLIGNADSTRINIFIHKNNIDSRQSNEIKFSDVATNIFTHMYCTFFQIFCILLVSDVIPIVFIDHTLAQQKGRN